MMEAQYTRDNLVAVLRRHAIKPTHQRIEIAYALFSRGEHLSADQVLAIVNDRHSETSKATVYNTLNLFASKGMLRHLNVEANHSSFDSNTTPHFHFHVENTGELIDVSPGDIEFARLPELPPGTESAGVEVVIRVRRLD